jgi:class 3 adenylate cyclase
VADRGSTASAPCDGCGAEPPAGARFCHSCGTPLGPRAAQAEFKQVTVLFADVVGSMELAAAVGAERLREIMTELFNCSSAAVVRYGGTIDKFTGDGLMAVFGAPVALEDHAVRACLAALDIQAETQRIAAEVKRRDSEVHLQVRVGLNSGEVVAGGIGSGPTSYTTVGEQVGMAQRMESAAAPGEVLLSESTARLVEHATVLDEPQPVHVKGFASPLPAYRLVSATPDHRRTRQLSTLVGRDWEKSTIAAMLEQAIAGKGRIVGLVGPPGIGKSRMATELAAQAADRSVDVFTASCQAHTAEIPFHAAAALLRDIFGIGGLETHAARASVRGRLPDADPEDLVSLDDLLGIRDDETPLPAIDPAALGRRLSALLNSATAARTTSSMYVIEDVHWIDEVSEAMIAQLAAVVPQTRSFLLLTYRPEYGRVLDQLPGAHRIALAPLDDSESLALATELLGEDSSVATLVGRVADHAAGNPLFAEEIVRDLAERRVIDGKRGHYVCRLEPADLRVPASLQATIAARIDRLNPVAKRTLNAAAVIGSRFDADLLACLAAETDVAELVLAELIDQVSFANDGEYAFRHPLIRTVAYESQLKSDREQLHRLLAERIREDSSGDDANAALVAQHLEVAGDLRGAYDWHVRAGSWAQFRDVKAARASWQRARDVADRLPAEEPNKIAMQIGPRTALCASTFRISGSIEDAGYDELRQLCDSAGDKLSLAMGMAGTMTVLVFHNRFREAAELASECGHLAESFEDQIMTLTLSLAASNAKFQAGEVVEGLRLAQRGIELADGDHTNDNFMIGSPLGFAFGLRGVCRFALGVNGWRDDLDRSVQMTRAGDMTSRTATILFKDGFIVHNGGLLPDVLALAETADALDVAERVGDDFSLDMARLTHGLVLVHGDECDHAAGLELLDRYRQASARHEYTKKSVRWADAETAKHFAALGNFDDAIELARLAVDFLHDSGEMTSLGPAVTVLVESLLGEGSDSGVAQADAAVERLAAVPTDPGFVLHELPLLRLRALLARSRGDEPAYLGYRDRYRAMANDLGFEGHMATAAAMD